MFKFIALIALVLVASSVFAIEAVPKLHHANKLGEKVIAVQRCDEQCGNCQTEVEFPEYQCHLARHHGLLDPVKSAILKCGLKRERLEMTISIFHNEDGKGCTGKAKDQLVAKRTMVVNQCEQDPLGFGFHKFQDNSKDKDGKNLTMHRDCDEGCRNCGVILPVPSNHCLEPRMISRIAHLAFENSDPVRVSDEEIVMDGFPDFKCMVDPIFTQTLPANKCQMDCFRGECRYFKNTCM